MYILYDDEINLPTYLPISVLSVGLAKKEILGLFFRKSEKILCENEILSLVLVATEGK